MPRGSGDERSGDRSSPSSDRPAGVSPDDIDLLILGTFTPDMPLPATACLVQDRLGLRASGHGHPGRLRGFVYAMYTAMQFVATGSSRLALVIGARLQLADRQSGQRQDLSIVGDGAGADLGARQSGARVSFLRVRGRTVRAPACSAAAWAARDSFSPRPLGRRLAHAHGRRPSSSGPCDLLRYDCRRAPGGRVTIDDLDQVVFHQAVCGSATRPPRS